MSRCSCPRVLLHGEDGQEVETIASVDTKCPYHGFPRDKWYAGHPLRAHALIIDMKTGEPITHAVARDRYRDPENQTYWAGFDARFRLERPSETYARLIKEAS